MGSTDYYRDRIAIVTGGASGIGRGLTVALSRLGATVVCADIDVAGARETALRAGPTGSAVEPVRLDVTREDDVNRVVDGAVASHGRLDFMFNNAGVGIGGEVRDTTGEHWRRIMDVNLWGTIWGTLAAYRVMIRQGSGTIVNIASVAGLLPVPALAAYAASKHAVVGLTTSLRPEAVDFGVKVCAACPGAVDTPLFRKTEILQTDMDRLLRQFPFMMDADKTAKKILTGVRRNKAVIVFPLSNYLLWRFFRLWPRAVEPLSLKMARDFRRFRKDD